RLTDLPFGFSSCIGDNVCSATGLVIGQSNDSIRTSLCLTASNMVNLLVQTKEMGNR
uniref:Uncharacterized protein n=1 Tax=Aegilops tauschii subsp. strangulata TaxID=200361 RepID=A0A453GD64_AEGTS